MAEFTLKITLGNDAMKEIPDIIQSLKNVCAVLSGINDINDIELYGPVKIHDINGNIVGNWRVK